MSAYTLLGQFDAAEEVIRRISQIHPRFEEANNSQLCWLKIIRGDAAAALELASDLRDPVEREFYTALALQLGDDRNAADTALQGLMAMPASTQTSSGVDVQIIIAIAHAMRKEPDQMFEWMQRSWANLEDFKPPLYSMPWLKPGRDDPRFAALARKYGLPAPDELR